jgi:hypothetical protein
MDDGFLDADYTREFEQMLPARPQIGWFAANKKKILIGAAVFIIAVIIGLVIHLRKPSGDPPAAPATTSAASQKPREKHAWDAPYTPVTKLEDALAGGDFILLQEDGTPNLWVTIERKGDRGSFKTSYDSPRNSPRPLTWVDRPTPQDLVHFGWPVKADVILRYDNGHISALRRTGQGVFQFVDIDVIVSTAGSPQHLEEKVFTLARGVMET